MRAFRAAVLAFACVAFAVAAVAQEKLSLPFVDHRLRLTGTDHRLTTADGEIPVDFTTSAGALKGKIVIDFPDAALSGLPSGDKLVFDKPITTTIRFAFTWTTGPGEAGTTPYSYSAGVFFTDVFGGSKTICHPTAPSVGNLAPNTPVSVEATFSCVWPEMALCCAQVEEKSVQIGSILDFTSFGPQGFSGFFEGLYSTWRYKPESKELKVELLDPNCRDANDMKCDAYFLDDLREGGVVAANDSLSELAKASVKRTGVTADGAATLLLRVSSILEKTGPGDTVTLTLPGNPVWGRLARRDGSAEGTSVTLPFETLSADGRSRVAYGLYFAPDDHPAPDKLNDTYASLTAAVSSRPSDVEITTIRIVPPRVVLVHGVWSGHAAWEDLEVHLENKGWVVCPGCRPDYGRQAPAGSFDPLSREGDYVLGTVVHAIERGLRDARRAGYASAKVDAIGHSMGGISLRARAASTAFPYRAVRNRKQGDIHKLISVGSPHLGSSLVDFLLDYRCTAVRWSLGGVLDPYLETFLRWMGKPMGPAIFGFQTASQPLANIGRTLVHGHAIIGVEPSWTKTEESLNLIIGSIRDSWASTQTIDSRTGGAGYHDTIVPVPSQSGQLGPFTTTVNNVLHANMQLTRPLTEFDETEHQDVWKRIEELLRVPVGDGAPTPLFGPFPAMTMPAGAVPKTPGPCGSSSRTVGSQARVEAASVAMTPAPGTVVRPGAALNLSMTISGGTPVTAAFFAMAGDVETVQGSGPAFTVVTSAPANLAGRVDITAFTIGGETGYGGSTWIDVQPESAPGSIAALPDDLLLVRGGMSIQLVVLALAGSTQVDVTSSTAGTAYATSRGTEAVVRVTADGLVTAVGPGSDSIVVTHRGRSTTVPVAVEITPRRRAVRH